MNSPTREQVAAPCNVCQGDGWIAYPAWADVEKKTIRIRKVACPHGCPLANPDEKGVLPWMDVRIEQDIEENNR